MEIIHCSPSFPFSFTIDAMHKFTERDTKKTLTRNERNRAWRRNVKNDDVCQRKSYNKDVLPLHFRELFCLSFIHPFIFPSCLRVSSSRLSSFSFSILIGFENIVERDIVLISFAASSTASLKQKC